MKMLKTAILVAGLALVALTTVPVSASQGKNLDFTLVNKTGLGIDEVYLSPTSEDEWGSDVMGRDVLKTGEKVMIKFSTAETECNWDLKIVDEEKDPIVWKKLNLCTAEEITLMYENHVPTAVIK
jgi:hypothetical protein